MQRFVFTGVSDDILKVEVEHKGKDAGAADVYCLDGEGNCSEGVFLLADKTGQCFIVGKYQVECDTWMIGVAPADEDSPLPAFQSFQYRKVRNCAYSIALEIKMGDDAYATAVTDDESRE